MIAVPVQNTSWSAAVLTEAAGGSLTKITVEFELAAVKLKEAVPA
jgi:hypothetical protein